MKQGEYDALSIKKVSDTADKVGGRGGPFSSDGATGLAVRVEVDIPVSITRKLSKGPAVENSAVVANRLMKQAVVVRECLLVSAWLARRADPDALTSAGLDIRDDADHGITIRWIARLQAVCSQRDECDVWRFSPEKVREAGRPAKKAVSGSGCLVARRDGSAPTAVRAKP